MITSILLLVSSASILLGIAIFGKKADKTWTPYWYKQRY